MSGDRLPGWSHVCPRAKEHANITLLFLNLCKKILVVLQSARCMKTWPSKKSRKTLKRKANFCLINQVFGCTAQNCQFCHSDIHILVLNHISRCRGFLKKWCSIPTVLSTLRDCRVSRSSQSVSQSVHRFFLDRCSYTLTTTITFISIHHYDYYYDYYKQEQVGQGLSVRPCMCLSRTQLPHEC